MAAADVNLKIDGHTISVAKGSTIWQAAGAAGIDIPVLCHDPKLRPVGVCRMCVVDVGGRVLVAACVREADDGMQVDTCSQKIERQRQMLTRLLLADHPVPCARERTTADCDLEALVLSRARQALEVGCDGVISSGLEVPKLREYVDNKLLVISPGIRPVDNKPMGDQKRVVTVETAFSNGADYIVVGRPIRDAASPRATAEAMQASIQSQVSKND